MTDCDAIIIGGGPGGATAARQLALAGHRIVLLEKAAFPRFHIGESVLPYNLPLLRRLGLEDRLRQLPHVVKLGAEFVLGGDPDSACRFSFEQDCCRARRRSTLSGPLRRDAARRRRRGRR